MVEQTIEGRGGSAMCYIKPEPGTFSHQFLITSGASRERQFDDFWLVKVGLDPSKPGEFKITKQKLDVKERDGFGSRNALTSVCADG